jgi:2-methylcitrate dehydratase PrpD
MMSIAQIHALSQRAGQLSPATRREIEKAYVDTLAVLCAGWDEPVTTILKQVHRDVRAPWLQSNATEPEVAALVWGTAAHALDYDDVHMTSVTHPSAVLFPAIEAVAQFVPQAQARRAGAYALGLAVNVGLGQAMGFVHYAHGWHATSTIGAVAAGAAIAHLLDLDEKAFAAALAIAAAQSGGLQRNFGTMTKPLQAGLAAQAGVRAARLAQAGLEGASDVFAGPNGFLAVFGGTADAGLELDLDAAASGLSRKLFACCYMAHRPVAAAIQLHERLAAGDIESSEARIEVEVPAGCLKALTIAIPRTGAEAKFSGQYTVAHALLRGELGLSAFLEDQIVSPDVVNLARRVTLRESAAPAARDVGIDRGDVTVNIVRSGNTVARAIVSDYPGSPTAPITDAELDTKLADCVAIGAPRDPLLAGHLRSLAARFADLS